jgi:uncharacterized protein (TIGR03435 family)
LQSLLMTAYGVGSDQISGPDWLQRERYEVVAKVPPGATKEQANVMLQNLLAERFHVSFHRVVKEFPEYSLVVAKGGPKLKETTGPSILEQPPSLDALRNLKTDGNGFLQLPPGMRVASTRRDGVTLLTFRAYSILELTQLLRLPLGKITGGMWATGRISDKTGLAGKYDFTLEFAGSMAPGGAFAPLAAGQDVVGPDLFEALEKQLGLKLEKSKVQLDVVVVDHADKVPTKN